jgi:hypothetical protein
MTSPQPPIRKPMFDLETPIVDSDGNPTFEFWRVIEAIRTAIGGDFDLVHLLGVLGDSSSAQIQSLADDVVKLQAELLASRTSSGLLGSLLDEVTALRAQMLAQQVQGNVSDALEDVRAQLAVVQAQVDQVGLRPTGIDIVTNSNVASNAGIDPTKLSYPTVSTELASDVTGIGNTETTLMQVSLSDCQIPTTVKFLDTVVLPKNASTGGIQIEVKARVSDADMTSNPTAGTTNYEVFSDTATESGGSFSPLTLQPRASWFEIAAGGDDNPNGVGGPISAITGTVYFAVTARTVTASETFDADSASSATRMTVTAWGKVKE